MIGFGALAVDFFFMLSGPILVHAHRRQIAADSLNAGAWNYLQDELWPRSQRPRRRHWIGIEVPGSGSFSPC